jgi:hypothetical protein
MTSLDLIYPDLSKRNKISLETGTDFLWIFQRKQDCRQFNGLNAKRTQHLTAFSGLYL